MIFSFVVGVDHQEQHTAKQLYSFGRDAFRSCEYEQAYSFFSDAVEKRINRAKYSYWKARAAEKLGLISDALFAYESALILEPDFGMARLRRADLLACLGYSEDAYIDYLITMERGNTERSVTYAYDRLFPPVEPDSWGCFSFLADLRYGYDTNVTHAQDDGMVPGDELFAWWFGDRNDGSGLYEPRFRVRYDLYTCCGHVKWRTDAWYRGRILQNHTDFSEHWARIRTGPRIRCCPFEIDVRLVYQRKWWYGNPYRDDRYLFVRARRYDTVWRPFVEGLVSFRYYLDDRYSQNGLWQRGRVGFYYYPDSCFWYRVYVSIDRTEAPRRYRKENQEFYRYEFGGESTFWFGNCWRCWIYLSARLYDFNKPFYRLDDSREDKRIKGRVELWREVSDTFFFVLANTTEKNWSNVPARQYDSYYWSFGVRAEF